VHIIGNETSIQQVGYEMSRPLGSAGDAQLVLDLGQGNFHPGSGALVAKQSVCQFGQTFRIGLRLDQFGNDCFTGYYIN
jgi:hypothetical protein